MGKKVIKIAVMMLLCIAIPVTTSISASEACYAKTLDPVKKSLGTVSKSNRNRCISSKGTYSLSVANQGKVTSTVYNIAYVPNKHIDKEIKNLRASKTDDSVSLLLGLVPKVGAAFSVGCYYKNKQIDGMISKLKKIKKTGKGAQLTLSKTSGAPRSWTAISWDGKTIMKKSYKYEKNKSVHKMVVKKADIKYGKK